jgi:hypothetical protein
LLLALDSKTNTLLIEKIEIIVETPNYNFRPIYMIVHVSIFFMLLLGFVCGCFEHADLNYRKWMPISKALLPVLIMQLFGSPAFTILFTLFGLQVAPGFGLASQILTVILEVFHFYLWFDGFFYEQVLTDNLATWNCR